MSTRFAPLAAAALIAACAAALPCHAAMAVDSVIRHNVPTFPIAATIEVPAGYSTIYVSGMGADIADKSAKPMTLAAYGDTETQTRSALKKIAATLAGLHLTLGDVVQMHAYIAAGPKLAKIDFAGMMKAYKEFFGTHDQPNLPTRSAFQVAGLANPGWLIEIEVQAVRKP
jgi:enamine deaminase RidA (YjgF/YER057c/UK114 family)